MLDRIERRIGSQAIKSLANASVGVVGLGSLGSQITELLAMSGVGKFILVDPDILEEHNVVRHAADLRYVGLPKVDAVADLVGGRGKTVGVEPHAVDVMTNPEILSTADLVIVAGLGSEITQSRLARKIRSMGKPALYGGLYQRAIAGEAFVVDPKEGPCYACFASHLREVDTTEGPPVNYGLPLDEVKAEPGLGIDVARVASVVAKWTLSLLINDQAVIAAYPGNLLILANDEYQLGVADGKPVMLAPFYSQWMRIPKVTGCSICGLVEDPNPVSIEELKRRYRDGSA